MTREHVLHDPLIHLAHIQKLHFLSMGLVRVINNINHLLITHPASSMKT